MDYYGLPTGSVENDFLRLEYLTRGGLRLVRLSAFGSPNLFAELPDIGWQTPHGFYRILGGHRFWVAPETEEITYLTEPAEITAEELPGGIRLRQPVDHRCGLRKTIEIHIQPNQASFTLRHHLHNEGPRTLQVAAWGITQFSLGGMAAFPQPANRVDAGGFLPNRSLVLWPYTRLNDRRLHWMEKYLMIRAEIVQSACKVGYNHPSGWGVYWNHGVLVRKSVTIQMEATYPDFNSPMEMYIDHRFFELESLSPLLHLAPGEQIWHEEHFDLFAAPGLQDEQDLADFLDHLPE